MLQRRNCRFKGKGEDGWIVKTWVLSSLSLASLLRASSLPMLYLYVDWDAWKMELLGEFVHGEKRCTEVKEYRQEKDSQKKKLPLQRSHDKDRHCAFCHPGCAVTLSLGLASSFLLSLYTLKPNATTGSNRRHQILPR